MPGPCEVTLHYAAASLAKNAEEKARQVLARFPFEGTRCYAATFLFEGTGKRAYWVTVSVLPLH